MRGIVRRTGSVGRILGCRRCNGAVRQDFRESIAFGRRCPQESRPGPLSRHCPMFYCLWRRRRTARGVAAAPRTGPCGMPTAERPRLQRRRHRQEALRSQRKSRSSRALVRVTNEKLVNKSMPATIGWTYKKKIALVFLATDLLVGTSGVTARERLVSAGRNRRGRRRPLPRAVDRRSPGLIAKKHGTISCR